MSLKKYFLKKYKFKKAFMNIKQATYENRKFWKSRHKHKTMG